jgi:hypothetical protein
MCSTRLLNRSQWPRVLRRGSAAVRLLGLWVRIPPVASCGYCTLSGGGLCVGLIPSPEESYGGWCVKLSVIVKPGQYGGPGPLGAVEPWKKSVYCP